MRKIAKLIITIHIVTGALILKVLDRENFIPFDQWRIFTVVPTYQTVYFIYAKDIETKSECLLKQCRGYLPGNKNFFTNNWTQRMGKAYDKKDWETVRSYRELFQKLLPKQKNLELSLYRAKINMVTYREIDPLAYREKISDFSELP